MGFLKGENLKFIDSFIERKVRAKWGSVLDEFTDQLNTKWSQDNWAIINPSWFGIPAHQKTDAFLREYIGWNYANVSAIAEAVSDIQIKLYRYDQKKEEVEEVKEHPLLELLYKVNPSMTKNDFFFILQANLLLTGEAPIRLRRVSQANLSQPPYELYPLNPADVKIFIGSTSDGFEMVERYEVRDKQRPNEWIKLKPWEVIFIKNVNPNNPWRGAGVVEAAARTIDTLNYSEIYNLNFFKNSAVPYTVLYTENKLNKETIDRLRNLWTSKYEGPENAYKTAILDQGLKIERLQTAAKDMDFLEQQRFLRDKLMAMYKTTKVVLGIVEDVNRANAEASEYVFMKRCVRPKMRKLVDYLNEFLVPLFDPDGTKGIFLDFEDPVQEDKTTEYTQLNVAVNKWITINEAREQQGREPIDGGDEIWQPLNLAPIGPMKPKTEKPTEKPEEQPEEGVEEGQPELEEIGGGKYVRVLRAKRVKGIPKRFAEQIAKMRNRNVMIKQLTKEIEEQIKKIVRVRVAKKYNKEKPKYKNILTKETKEKFSVNQIKISEKFEAKIQDIIENKIYKPQQEEIASNIKKIGVKFLLKGTERQRIKSASNYMFDKEKWVIAAMDLLTPEIEAIIETQGQEAMDLLGQGMNYSLLEAARQYLNKEPLKASKSFNDTIYEKVRNALAEGLAKGESETQLIERVRDVYSNLEDYQAQRIARTEVSRATNFATLDGYRQSGIVKGKQFLTAQDERVCEWCGPLDGKIVGLEENFFDKGDSYMGNADSPLTFEYGDVEAPPLHVNCRCTIVPVLEEVKSEEPETKSERNSKEVIKSEAEVLLEKIEKELNDAGRAQS